MKLPIKLTPKQKELDASTARFKIAKWGRRTGKTKYEAYWLAKNALTMGRGKHWYLTRTLALAREEFWPNLFDLLPRDCIARTDERSLSVKLTNGSTISCKSGEKEDNLRGRGLRSVVPDEAAFLKERIWDNIIRPQLADFMGPALIASSPKKGWFTRLYNEAAKGTDPNWFASHATIYDNPYISRDEIEVIKAKTPPNTWLQEYMAEEVSEEGQVYDEFSAKNIFDPSQKFNDARTFDTLRGLDWGTDDPAGCVWVGISPEGYLVISDEHEHANWDPQRHAEVINTKSASYPRIRQSVLDNTAFRKESDLTSVADQFRDAGIPCQRSEKDVPSSIAIVKRFLRGDGEKPWLYVSARCAKLITALQEWEHGDHEPDIAAAMRYAITWAVTRRMSRLADSFPMIHNAPSKPYSEKEAALIFAQQARVVPVSRKKSWTLTEYGVPG